MRIACIGDWRGWPSSVILGDDACRIRKGQGPAMMASIKQLCLNLFDQEPSTLSLAKKKRKAAWNDQYRANVIFSEQF